ncbi:MAG: YeeE/YedE family protein [Spirochaetaceae bacterium]|nr:YeeE/YedE family protein [Spirochaetaceae bacterium]
MNGLSIFSGLAVGALLGWSLQRGGFCMNTAFRSILFREDRTALRAWILILLINLPIVALLENLGVLYPARAPFRPWALAVGGLIFGAGMVWAGGCVSGTYYRASKGMLGSFLALLGFFAGALAATTGALAPLRAALNMAEWTIAGEIPTLGHIWPADPWTGRWIAIGVLAIPGLVFLARSPKSRFYLGWNWPKTGFSVGILALAAWVFSSLEGRDYGLSLVQPTVAWASWTLFGDKGGLNWTAWMLLALPLGAFLAAWKAKDLRLRLPDPKRALIQFSGGLAMGVGAAVAGGCNIGHGITGLSALALSSLAATLFTMAGNWAATALIWHQTINKAAD